MSQEAQMFPEDCGLIAYCRNYGIANGHQADGSALVLVHSKEKGTTFQFRTQEDLRQLRSDLFSDKMAKDCPCMNHIHMPSLLDKALGPPPDGMCWVVSFSTKGQRMPSLSMFGWSQPTENQVTP